MNLKRTLKKAGKRVNVLTGKDRLSNSIIQRNKKRWLEAKDVWLPKDKPILEQTEKQTAELKRKKSQKDPLIDLLGL